MRYQSFYPFEWQQSPPNPLGQPGFRSPPFQGQQQAPTQPFQGRPMNNSPYPGQMQGAPPQGPSKMESYMQTANRFLNTAQQYAPVVQQFAPMMQNLPAMWKLYKGFQSLPSTGPTGPAVASRTASTVAQNAAPIGNPMPSIPRIFQPPGL